MSYTEFLIRNWIIVLVILLTLVVGAALFAALVWDAFRPWDSDDYVQVREGRIVTDVLEQRDGGAR